jgi:hypothetical protein
MNFNALSIGLLGSEIPKKASKSLGDLEDFRAIDCFA